MKPIVISSVDDELNYVPFKLPNGSTVAILRMDYIDEDTFDVMNEELEALDAKQQIIAVANDIVESPVKAKLDWQPLLEATKDELRSLGVDIRRRTDGEDGRRDVVSAPSQRVVDAVAEHAKVKPLELRKRGKEVALTMLKHVVGEEEFKEFAKMRVGQLNQVLSEWRKHSQVTLGE